MTSQTRVVTSFGLFTAALIAFAVLGTKALPEESPVTSLPIVPTSMTDVNVATLGAAAGPVTTTEKTIRLLQAPSLGKTQIAFEYAGELWIVQREGGVARRLASGQLRNHHPIFSPDGSQIAFTANYDGNVDVYVMSANGGEPRRLTYHPSQDIAVGWTPDSTKVLFNSLRATPRDLPQLYTVPVTGGLPEKLPLPSGTEASYSADGSHLAYIPFSQWQPEWRKYRGGQTTPIWIANLADSSIVKVPRDNSNDRFPMWVGDQIYFVSDRNGPFTLFAWDQKGAVRELIKNPDGFDMRYASAGPGGIVYEELGALKLYDIASGTAHTVPITIEGEMPGIRPRFEKISGGEVLHATPSPNGKRVLFEAHGEIISVPAEKGDARNITRTPGSSDRDPAWSPDGKWIAWLSDEPGEYALYIRSPDGFEPVRKVDLGAPPSFYYSPRWSPDSKKITLTDKRLNLWLIDLARPTPTRIDTGRYDGNYFDPAWSPDSKAIAYVKTLPNHMDATFIYTLEDKKTHQVTDGRSNTSSPRFDRSGKYLFFLARTDIGLTQGGGEMTAMAHPQTSNAYVAVLDKDLPSPLAPESDEEGDADKKDKKGKKEKGEKGDKGDKGDHTTKIDFDGIDQRIVALPTERANYVGLEVGGDGILFMLIMQTALSDEDYIDFAGDESPPVTVMRFDLATRKNEKFLEKIDGFDSSNGGLLSFSVTAEGNKVLFAEDKKWFLVGADKSPKPGEGMIKVDGVEVFVDPRAEWKQMFHEIWRIERDFLYDPGAHGLDLAAAEKLYAPFVDAVASRNDLNVLFEDMLGNLVLGHVWAWGGTQVPKQDHINVGLLGADYQVQDGRYRFARILRGEGWNPKLRAPLTQPGIDVKEGNFLLAVNGQDLKGDDDVDRLFQGRAGKQTVITVAATANGGGSHKVTVVPTGSESGLRLRTWMEEEKAKVDQLSNNRVAYVFVPDTGGGGLTNFDRYFFSQVDKDAVIIDERFNHGGQIADYIVNILGWTAHMGAATREGEDVMMPPQAIFGPKVMIANQMSGSGGDALPWLFKRAKLGPLVGVRTWGGLVGIGGYPHLIDGGRVTAPRWGLYGTNGEWEVENHGIAPDVEVEQDPALMREGHDPQLERAVALAMEALVKNPPQRLKRPPYSDYGPRLPKRN